MKKVGFACLQDTILMLDFGGRIADLENPLKDKSDFILINVGAPLAGALFGADPDHLWSSLWERGHLPTRRDRLQGVPYRF